MTYRTPSAARGVVSRPKYGVGKTHLSLRVATLAIVICFEGAEPIGGVAAVIGSPVAPARRAPCLWCSRVRKWSRLRDRLDVEPHHVARECRTFVRGEIGERRHPGGGIAMLQVGGRCSTTAPRLAGSWQARAPCWSRPWSPWHPAHSRVNNCGGCSCGVTAPGGVAAADARVLSPGYQHHPPARASARDERHKGTNRARMAESSESSLNPGCLIPHSKPGPARAPMHDRCCWSMPRRRLSPMELCGAVAIETTVPAGVSHHRIRGRGDRRGEPVPGPGEPHLAARRPKVADDSPPLSPRDALATFYITFAGYRLKLVASQPLSPGTCRDQLGSSRPIVGCRNAR